MLEVTAQITLKKKSLAFTMVNTYLHRFQSAICWEKKILICSSCSLIGKKNVTSVNLLQLLAFLGRSPELPDRVS